MLRMKDPDSYVSMINYFENTLINQIIARDSDLKNIFDNIDSDDVYYVTRADKTEEKIVKYLDKYRGDQIDTVHGLKQSIDAGFNILFGGDIETDRSDTIIKRLQWMSKHNFNKKSLFEETSTGINMLELAKREQRKHILNKIIEKCY